MQIVGKITHIRMKYLFPLYILALCVTACAQDWNGLELSSDSQKEFGLSFSSIQEKRSTLYAQATAETPQDASAASPGAGPKPDQTNPANSDGHPKIEDPQGSENLQKEFMAHLKTHPPIQPVKGKNPSRQEISDCMEHDLIRAIGWQESKWKQFRNDGRTVVSRNGAAGIMQVTRATWAEWFSKDGQEPDGYVICTWDDMRNNWQTNIHNGRYLVEVYTQSMMTNEQKQWPFTARSQSIPNQQDLIVYAYKHSPEDVKRVSKANWSRTVGKNSYVRLVRGHMSRKPWNTVRQITSP